MSSPTNIVEQVREQFGQLLGRFETAWEDGAEPEISDFLFLEPIEDQAVRHQLLLELVKLDLSSRWKQMLPKGGGEAPASSGADEQTVQLPRVERYVVEWPELGPKDRVDVDLIVHEYRTRQRFGDRPHVSEFETRFPAHGQTLSVPLGEAETEFREMREGSTAPGIHIASMETSQGTLLPGVGTPEPKTEVDAPPAGAAGFAGAVEMQMGNFGNYDLQEELGRGAMGIVYRARQLRPDRPVALKTISKGKLASVEQVRTFFAEANSAGNLRHPHIVTVYDSGEVDGQHYFSMAYIEGKSLDEIVEPGETLDPRRAAKYIRTTAEAIEYAHSMGVLHRDLKPGNVLIDENDEPHVADFGIASRLEDDSTSPVHGEVVGTPSFMPPEQAQGRADLIGPTSDVYSLGATLYCLLTGVPPFGGGDVLATLMQVIDEPPKPIRQFNKSVDRYLQAICLKCLAKKPSDRYASAQELADDLGRYLRNEPTVALSPPMVIRFTKWCRRNPAVARLTIVILLILLGTSGVMSTLYLQLRVVHGSVTDLEDDKKRLEKDKTRFEGELVVLADQADESKRIAEDSARKAAASAEKAAESSKRLAAADTKLAKTNSDLEVARKSLEPLQAMLADSKKMLDFSKQMLATSKLQLKKQTAALAEAKEEVAASGSKLKANQLALVAQKKQLAKAARDLEVAETEERKQLRRTSDGQRELGKTYGKLGENEQAKQAFGESIVASGDWVKKAAKIPAEQKMALLGVAESNRLLGDLHVNLEELKPSAVQFQAAEAAISRLKTSGLGGEDVQFSSAQLFNSRAVAFEIQGLLDLQLQHLESARNAYVALIGTAAKANAIRYRQKLARTYYNLGRAYDRLCSQGKSNDWKQVVSAYDKAVTGLESLRDDASGDRELELAVIQELAQTLQERSSGWLGYADATTGEAAMGHERQAIRDADASIALCQVLVEKAPRNPQYRVDRIYARMTRATLYPVDQVGNTEAEKLYLSGITALETIVEEHQVPAHRSLLADARTNLGVLYQDWPPTRVAPASKRAMQAREQFTAALKEAERLHVQFPGLASYQYALADALRNMADLLKERDGAAAARFATRGLGLIKPLVRRYPGRPDYKSLAENLAAVGR
tara:strand:- start:2200 stop:5571 length:3372 start_codon:yes stop_codon:yes gene_type:complete